MGRTLCGEGVGRARRPERAGRARPPLHRPPPHPRGHVAPGLRRPAARGRDRTPSGPHPGDRGPQRPDHRLGQADRRCVGATELRVPGRHRAPVRRHLPRQLRQVRSARGAGRREGRPAAVGPPRVQPRGHRDRRPGVPHRARRTGADAIEDSFDIDDYTRWRLLEGLDDVGITLSHADDIATYEGARPSWKPVTQRA